MIFFFFLVKDCSVACFSAAATPDKGKGASEGSKPGWDFPKSPRLSDQKGSLGVKHRKIFICVSFLIYATSTCS